MSKQNEDPIHIEPRVTTVESHEWKARIEPYASSPTMHLESGEIGCAFCANTKFRRSRVRFYDLLELMLLRYPMRCMRCNQRQYGYFLTAALAIGPRDHSNRPARGNDTWKAWTESEMNGHVSQRPMTTSIGPRATKLQRPVRRPPAPTGTQQPWRDDDRHIW